MVFIPGRGGHPPYGAPIGYQDKYDPDHIKSKYPLREPYISNKPSYYSKSEGIPYWHNLTTVNESLFYQLNAVYLGMLNYNDWIFGELIDIVNNYTNMTNVNIVYSSDHGDYAGDYRMVEKWPGGMDDNLINIPMLMQFSKEYQSYFDKINSGKNLLKNVTISTQVTQSFDIMETFIQMANITREWITLGESFLDIILQQRQQQQQEEEEEADDGYDRNNVKKVNDYLNNKFAYCEGGFYFSNNIYPNGSDHLNDPQSIYWPKNEEVMANNGTGCPRVVAMMNVYYKLVKRPNGYVSEFYDLTKDPKTLNNLWNTNDTNYQSIKYQMLQNLTDWYLLTSDITPILLDPRNLPPQASNV